MNRSRDARWEQLRAIESDLLSPPPEDPFQTVPKGWRRAAELTDADWEKLSRKSAYNASPPPVDPLPSRASRPNVRSPRPPVAHVQPMRSAHERRPLPRHNNQPAVAPYQNPRHVDQQPEVRRRPLSPTQLPGVRAIPKNYNHYFRGLLTPGEFFAKSTSRYLGPFDEMPTETSLPLGDDYIILQRMGRLPESGKSIFRQVGNVSN